MAVRNLTLQRFISQTLAEANPIEGEIDLTGRGQEKYFYAHGARFQDAAKMTSGAIIVINLHHSACTQKGISFVWAG